MDATPFMKMHGLGNDFVVIDARGGAAPSRALMAAMADRRRGVGCDQIAVLGPSRTDGAACFLRNYNAPDATEIEACGNATRCVARLLMDESGAGAVQIETVAGLLSAERAENGAIVVDMGVATVRAARLALPGAPAFVTIGNPHCVLFVGDADAADVAGDGPRYEHDPAFPEGANVSFAQVTGPGAIRLRVWERHTGQTQACGSAACATVAAALARGLTGPQVRVTLDGGDLDIAVDQATGRVRMAGPAAYVFTGVYQTS